MKNKSLNSNKKYLIISLHLQISLTYTRFIPSKKNTTFTHMYLLLVLHLKNLFPTNSITKTTTDHICKVSKINNKCSLSNNNNNILLQEPTQQQL